LDSRAGVADPIVPLIANTEAHQRAGGFAVGAGHFDQLTGRPPLPLRELLLTYSAMFAGPRH
jgi:hypothetical protein